MHVVSAHQGLVDLDTLLGDVIHLTIVGLGDVDWEICLVAGNVLEDGGDAIARFGIDATFALCWLNVFAGFYQIIVGNIDAAWKRDFEFVLLNYYLIAFFKIKNLI